MTFQERARQHALQWADALCGMAVGNGHYADALAAAVWHRIDPVRYRGNIDQALESVARRSKPPGRYHTEFARYGLRHLPHPDNLLAQARPMRPKVANWLLLGTRHRLMHRLIRWAFERDGAIYDRFPSGFSAGYHAFSSALLSEAGRSVSGPMEVLSELEGGDGFPAMLGRGAGQSFGHAAAIWAFACAGQLDAADRCLARLPQQPCLMMQGIDTPGGPGWYHYNHLEDYVAFAALALLKASACDRASPAIDASKVWARAGRVSGAAFPTYRALLMGQGDRLFDGAVQPVLMANGQVLMPPTAAEPVPPTLYRPQNLPLPPEATPTRFKVFPGGLVQDYALPGGGKGQRRVTCLPDEIILEDRLTLSPGMQTRAPRLILPHPSPNIEVSSTPALTPEATPLVTIFGPARAWSRPIHGSETVRVRIRAI